MTDGTNLDTIKNKEYRMGENNNVKSWDVFYDNLKISKSYTGIFINFY